ncbi:MAG: hypothetical protein RLZZ189_2497 [Pseudomonadota bacterium]|jgi:hypothetical protein
MSQMKKVFISECFAVFKIVLNSRHEQIFAGTTTAFPQRAELVAHAQIHTRPVCKRSGPFALWGTPAASFKIDKEF